MDGLTPYQDCITYTSNEAEKHNFGNRAADQTRLNVEHDEGSWTRSRIPAHPLKNARSPDEVLINTKLPYVQPVIRHSLHLGLRAT